MRHSAPPTDNSDPVNGEAARAVLVIDDVAATRHGLAQLLRLRGFAALEAADGAEGLRVLRDTPHVCVVVLDLLMPRANGYWFREQQLQDPALAHIPVIVFTGADDVPDTQLMFAEVLRKPVSVDALLEAVERCCRT